MFGVCEHLFRGEQIDRSTFIGCDELTVAPCKLSQMLLSCLARVRSPNSSVEAGGCIGEGGGENAPARISAVTGNNWAMVDSIPCVSKDSTCLRARGGARRCFDPPLRLKVNRWRRGESLLDRPRTLVREDFSQTRF